MHSIHPSLLKYMYHDIKLYRHSWAHHLRLIQTYFPNRAVLQDRHRAPASVSGRDEQQTRSHTREGNQKITSTLHKPRWSHCPTSHKPRIAFFTPYRRTPPPPRQALIPQNACPAAVASCTRLHMGICTIPAALFYL